MMRALPLPCRARYNPPVHIVHVYASMDPRDGGPPAVIKGLAAGQLAAGHRVTLVTQDEERAPAVEAFLAAHLPRLPARLSVRPRWPHPLDPAAGPLRALLAEADVLHVHGLWPPVNLLATQLARARRLPWVLTLHGMLHRAALHQKRLKKLVGFYALGYRRVVTDAAAIHVLNADERARAEGPPLPARVVEIPNGIFPEEFAELPAPGAFRRSVSGLGDAPFILALARLHIQKGPDLLIEAFARIAPAHPTLHLVFAGPEQGAGPLVQEAARRHGLADRVHLPGPRFGPDRIAALVDAAVFCLASRQEGFSLAITEALAAGVPCVVTDRCQFPQVGTEGCGKVTPLSAEGLARGLTEVLADPTEARAMGVRGRALVLDRYTWPRICTRMEAVYREIAR